MVISVLKFSFGEVILTVTMALSVALAIIMIIMLVLSDNEEVIVVLIGEVATVIVVLGCLEESISGSRVLRSHVSKRIVTLLVVSLFTWIVELGTS